MRPLFAIVLLALVTGVAAAPKGGKLYRWVDDEGNVHYSDQIPPEYANQAREQLNEQGITVDSVDAAPTPEQLEAAREKAKAEAQARQQKEEQRRRDTLLTNAYGSVADIKRARDQEISALQRTVDMTRAAQDSYRNQLRDYVHRAGDMQRTGRQVPDSLVTHMQEARAKIQERQDYIEQKRAEQATVFAEYEQDIDRFKELTGEEEDKKTDGGER